MQDTPSQNKYFLYVRKSSEQEERQALSIPAQLRELGDKFKNLKIVEVLSESHSAFIPEARPVFQEMLKRIDRGEADGIIAWHPNRLSRNEVDAAALTYRLRTGKIVDLKFGSYYFDPSPEGIMMLQIALSQSQYESAKQAIDIKRGNREKYARGGITWASPPGYLNNPITGVLDEDTERMPLIEKMWQMLLSGDRVPEIHTIAHDEWRFTTPQHKTRGGGLIAMSSLYRIFNNPLYAGLNIRPDGTHHKCNHRAIITEDQYWQAQAMLGRKGRPCPSKHRYLYGNGLMKCGHCGASIVGEQKHKRLKNGKLLHWTYYRCTRHNPEVACRQLSIRQEEMEIQINQYLGEITIPESFKNWFFEYLHEVNDQEAKERTQIVTNLQTTHNALQKKIDGLVDMRLGGSINDTEYREHKERFLQEKASVKEQLDDSESRAESWLHLVENAFNFQTYAQHWFNHGTDEDKKMIVRSLARSHPLLKDQKITFQSQKLFQGLKNLSQKEQWWS